VSLSHSLVLSISLVRCRSRCQWEKPTGASGGAGIGVHLSGASASLQKKKQGDREQRELVGGILRITGARSVAVAAPRASNYVLYLAPLLQTKVGGSLFFSSSSLLLFSSHSLAVLSPCAACASWTALSLPALASSHSTQICAALPRAFLLLRVPSIRALLSVGRNGS
jgi:hypothetical protein